MGDENVVEHDSRGHGPQFECNSDYLGEVGRVQILEEVGVGHLARAPEALECGVGNERCRPLALVSGIINLSGFPFATSEFLTLRVFYVRLVFVIFYLVYQL